MAHIANIDIVGADTKTPAKGTDYGWVPGLAQGAGALLSNWFGPKPKAAAAAPTVPWIPIMVGGGALLLIITVIATKK